MTHTSYMCSAILSCSGSLGKESRRQAETDCSTTRCKNISCFGKTTLLPCLATWIHRVTSKPQNPTTTCPRQSNGSEISRAFPQLILVEVCLERENYLQSWKCMQVSMLLPQEFHVVSFQKWNVTIFQDDWGLFLACDESLYWLLVAQQSTHHQRYYPSAVP